MRLPGEVVWRVPSLELPDLRLPADPARHDDRAQATPARLRTWRLILTGAALSIDNLAVGFALGTFHVSLALAAIVIGVVSVAMSLIGLELGNRIGARAGDRAGSSAAWC